MSSALLAVDDPMIKTMVEDAARELGVRVFGTRTPADVLRRVEENGSALLVLDLGADHFRPMSLIKRIKTDHPGARIIGFVSQSNAAMRTKAHDAGCDFVYTRPELAKQIKSIFRTLLPG
ncbi:MAG: hypothetical protein HUU25_08630 [Candidatus Sumerlaeia bacterium]|nr:hypothetical protein [Candidatus Sumerlaeia bacterium]